MKMHTRILLVAACLTVAASSQAALLVGTTSGSFTSPSANLTFTPGSFNTLTDSIGDYSLGNLGATIDSLGLFTLQNPTTASETFSGTFDLTVTFTSPASFSATYTASLSGRVFDTGIGGSSLKIVFDNPTQYIDFVDADNNPGVLSLSVLNVSIGRPTVGSQSVATLTGDGNVSVVPTPSSFAALGLGVLAVVRRRRRA